MSGVWVRLVAALFAGACLGTAAASEIEVRSARLAATEEGVVLEAEFDFEFGRRLEEIVASGVPLYFVVEFELVRRRWWWFDEMTASKRLPLRLSYHPLSRQYRISRGLLQQQFATLEEALGVLRRVRQWVVLERGATPIDGNYEAAVRMRLDVSQLPRPFQVSALASRELQLESPWRRFSWRPSAPAPRDSRQESESE